MMHTKYDDEIRELEARLAFEREALVHGAEDLTYTAKRLAGSTKGLVAAAVVGFVLGELTRPKRRPSRQSRKDEAPASKGVGLGGVLGGVALALIRAQFGSPLGMGKAALSYAAARRRARAAAPSDVGPSSGIAAPAMADPPYTPLLHPDSPRA